MKRNAMKIFGAVCLVLGFSTAAGAQTVDGIVKKMQTTNTITIGYRDTVLPTSYLDDQNKPTGYAVELCLRIIDAAKKELNLPQLKVNYVPVNIQNRQALVANGTVDLECDGAVNTFSRNKQVDFSPVTYVAASQLLVLKKSGISKFSDLNGKVVAIATGGSSEMDLKQIMSDTKLNIHVMNVENHAAGLIAVESHRADAYFSDNSSFFALIKHSKNPGELAIVGPEYGYSPQGLMIAKNNPTFMWIVNHSMGDMFKSGQAEAIFNKWFGPFGVKVSPKLRAAWDTFSYPE